MSPSPPWTPAPLRSSWTKSGTWPGCANIGCIVNLHQVDVAKTYGDRIVGIHQGRVVFDGPPQELTNSMIETIYDAPH